MAREVLDNVAPGEDSLFSMANKANSNFNDLFDGGRPIYAYDEGVRPSESAADNSSRFTTLLAAARTEQRKVVIGPGNHNFASAHVVDDIILEGQGMVNTILSWPSGGLGAKVAGLTLQSTSTQADRAEIRDLKVAGPTAFTIGGSKTASMAGVRHNYGSKLHRVAIEGCDEGAIVNSPVGHVTHHGCSLSGNYDNCYFTADGANHGDYRAIDNAYGGARRASICIAEDGNLVGPFFLLCHLGFAPYGIYQEAGSTDAGFVTSMRMYASPFEAIGNAAIWTEKATNGGNQGRFAEIDINHNGFSWDPVYKAGAWPHTYTIRVGIVDYEVNIHGSVGSFTNGPSGGMYINNLAGQGWLYLDQSMHLYQSNAVFTATLNAGDSNRITYKPQYAYRWSDQIDSGTTSKVITTTYAGPTASFKPMVQMTSDGGLTNPSLYVDTKTTDPSTNTSTFTVRVKGGTPSSNLTFTWTL